MLNLTWFISYLCQVQLLNSGACADLDVKTVMEEAKARWLRPNEIHAILCNYKYFTVHVRPVNLPKGNLFWHEKFEVPSICNFSHYICI